MTLIFTEEEIEWIETRKWGWPIKDGCPPELRKEIERKKERLNEQAKMFEQDK